MLGARGEGKNTNMNMVYQTYEAIVSKPTRIPRLHQFRIIYGQFLIEQQNQPVKPSDCHKNH